MEKMKKKMDQRFDIKLILSSQHPHAIPQQDVPELSGCKNPRSMLKLTIFPLCNPFTMGTEEDQNGKLSKYTDKRLFPIHLKGLACFPGVL